MGLRTGSTRNLVAKIQRQQQKQGREMNTFWLWPVINLVWSAILAIATVRFYSICRQWENKFEKRNR
jgi:hypothetical protein